MNEIFKNTHPKNRPVRDQYKLNLVVPRVNLVRFGKNSLRSLAPKIWNTLPYKIKSAENLKSFKQLIKNWNTASCQCNICFKL